MPTVSRSSLRVYPCIVGTTIESMDPSCATGVEANPYPRSIHDAAR
jgi:hypothetical protein